MDRRSRIPGHLRPLCLRHHRPAGPERTAACLPGISRPSRANSHPVPTVTVAFLGSVCGMTVNYLLGRTIGCYLVRRFGKLVHVTEEKIARPSHDWFERKGRWSLLFGYFLPGVRHLTAFAAGTTRMNFLGILASSPPAARWSGRPVHRARIPAGGPMVPQTARIHHVLEIGSLARLPSCPCTCSCGKDADGSNPR